MAVLTTTCSAAFQPVLRNFVTSRVAPSVSLALRRRGGAGVEQPVFYNNLDVNLLQTWYNLMECEDLTPFPTRSPRDLVQSIYQRAGLGSDRAWVVVLGSTPNQADLYQVIGRSTLAATPTLSNATVADARGVNALLDAACRSKSQMQGAGLVKEAQLDVLVYFVRTKIFLTLAAFQLHAS